MKRGLFIKVVKVKITNFWFTLSTFLLFITVLTKLQESSFLQDAITQTFEVKDEHSKIKGKVAICTCKTGKCTNSAKNPHYEAHYFNAFAAAANDIKRYGYEVEVVTEIEIFGPSYNPQRKDSRLNRAGLLVFNSDIIICSLTMMWKLENLFSSKKASKKPNYIMIEFTDPANLLTFEHRRDTHILTDWNDTIYESPRIKAIVLHTSLNPIWLNNDVQYLGSHYYANLLNIFSPGSNIATIREPQLSVGVMNKIHTLVPHVGRYMDVCLTFVWGSREQEDCYAQSSRNISFNDLQVSDEEREIDIYYGGSMHGKCGEYNTELKSITPGVLVNLQRCKIKDELQKLKIGHPDLNILIREGPPFMQNGRLYPRSKLEKLRTQERNKFLDIVRNSKICISPGGFGEFANKDFEIILSGCVLLKPGSRSLAQYGKLYEASSSLSSKLDLSDLQEILVMNLKNTDKLHGMAQVAIEKLNSTLVNFPRDVAVLLDSIIE